MPSTDAEPTDSALLAAAARGDCEAYGQVVSRHQTLVVSLAYSVCGEFAASEDIAQEAFVAAWRQLRQLNDSTKFKGWIGAIARNLALSHVRRRDRRGEHHASSDATAYETRDESAGPREQTVWREEAAAVWRSLAGLPEAYREPLILFYREGKSIERVAAALELSIDTVKQRLVRGRAMLRADLERTIERTLGFTTPGAMFKVAVLSALPAAGTAAAIAGGSSASAKLGAMSKLTFLGPAFLAPAIGLLATILGRRQSLRVASTAADRRRMNRLWGALSAIVVGGNVIFAVLIWRLRAHPSTGRETGISPILGWALFMIAAIAALAVWGGRSFVAYARNARLPDDATPSERRRWFGANRALGYRSRASLFGLPLLDIRFGQSPDAPLVRGKARGWVAIGDVAEGMLLALGGQATGAIAIGVVAFGLVPVGAIAVGGVAFGFGALGVVADGWFAAGYLAFGTFVGLGYEAARGLIAVAGHVAQGMFVAKAEHVRDMVVVEWDRTNWWSRHLREPLFTPWTALLIPLISLVGTNWLVRDTRTKPR